MTLPRTPVSACTASTHTLSRTPFCPTPLTTACSVPTTDAPSASTTHTLASMSCSPCPNILTVPMNTLTTAGTGNRLMPGSSLFSPLAPTLTFYLCFALHTNNSSSVARRPSPTSKECSLCSMMPLLKTSCLYQYYIILLNFILL